VSGQPRWDTDTVGRGVADAADLAPEAGRLVAAMAQPDWVAEQPEVHLLPHLERACAEPGSPVRIVDWSVDDTGTLVVHVEPWVAFPDRGSRRLAVHRLLAAIVETRTFVHEDPATGTVEAVTGVLDGDTAFAGHGHRIRIVVAEGESAR
jgi:hypothetical protein